MAESRDEAMSSLAPASAVFVGLLAASAVETVRSEARTRGTRSRRRITMGGLLEVLGLGVVAGVEGDAESEPGRDAAVVRLQGRSVAQDHVRVHDLEIPRLRDPIAQDTLEPEMARDPDVGEAEHVKAESLPVHGVREGLRAGGGGELPVRQVIPRADAESVVNAVPLAVDPRGEQ